MNDTNAFYSACVSCGVRCDVAQNIRIDGFEGRAGGQAGLDV